MQHVYSPQSPTYSQRRDEDQRVSIPQLTRLPGGVRIAAVPKIVRTVECVELTSSDDDDDDDVNNVSGNRNDEDECMIVDEPSGSRPIRRTGMPGAVPMPPPPPTRLDNSDTDDDEVEALSDTEDTDDVRAIKRRRRDECTLRALPVHRNVVCYCSCTGGISTVYSHNVTWQ